MIHHRHSCYLIRMTYQLLRMHKSIIVMSYGWLKFVSYPDDLSHPYEITTMHQFHTDDLVSSPCEIAAMCGYSFVNAWQKYIVVNYYGRLAKSSVCLSNSIPKHICYPVRTPDPPSDIRILLLYHTGDLLSPTDDLLSRSYVPTVYLCHTNELLSHPYDIALGFISYWWDRNPSVWDSNTSCVIQMSLSVLRMEQ